MEGSSRIRHTFYKKPMAPERTIMAGSALSKRTKRDTLFSEGMRRLSALDRHTTLEERNKVLGQFLNGLRVSGYGHPIRQDILEGVLQREEQLVRYGKPRYRTRREIKDEKAAREDRFVNTWILRGATTSTLKVQAMPGGALASKVRRKLEGVLAPDGGTTQVIEGAGKSVLAGLKKADPCLKPGISFRQKLIV